MGCCRPLTVALLACLIAAAARTAPAADPEAELPAELRGKTFKELAKPAVDFADQKLWPEAVGEYQRLIDEAGDRLVPLEKDGRTLVQVRRLVHARVAAFPPEALKLYRARVDATAKKHLEQGAAGREELLRRVVDEAFCASGGDEALDLLGDLAFERGRFDDAERWWRLLLPPEKNAPADDFELRYPDPQIDLARVRAKLLLSRLFRADRAGWEDERKAFRALHPRAEGTLAGRKGNYADTLEALAKQPGELAVVQPDDWPTFAGDPSRSRALPPDERDPNRLSRLCLLPPWRFDLEKRARVADGEPTPAFPPGTAHAAAARALAFHPVLVGGQALVADARHVTACDLNTGKVSTWFDLKERAPAALPDPKPPAKAGPRYTLTAADGRVFVRMGAAEIGAAPNKKGPPAGDSVLVCLDLAPEREGERFRWLVRPDPELHGTAVFEGSPAARDGRVYIAVSRFTADRAVTAIHCYPADARDGPAPRWRQEVCAADRPPTPRYRHHLLTLAGPNVVYCAHAGAVVALDAATGRPVWGFRYPSRGPTLPGNEPSPRDLAPCVYAAGRLFVAPADCDKLFCLDPATGQLLWQRDGVEVVHLLGVGKGRLIFTTPRGIRGVYAADGRDVPGWSQPAVDALAPFGRGLLAGDLVFWPVAAGAGLHVLKQEDGQQPDQLTPLQGKIAPGNLAIADGCLVVAGARELRVYAPPARHRARQEERVGAVPDSAVERYRLALAEADAGLHDRAGKSFREAERLAGQMLFGQSERLRREAKQGRSEVLLETARQAQARKEYDGAAALLKSAAAEEFPIPDRLQALGRSASVWEAAGKPEQAVAVWQGILSDPVLGSGRIKAAGQPQPAASQAAAEIDRLIRTHGRGVYEKVEARAAELLRGAAGDRRGEVLDRVVREFPNAKAAESARKRPAENDPPPARAAGAEMFLAPLERAWELPLAPGERLLGAAGGGRLFFAHGRRLTCRDAATGKTCWNSALGCGPVWIGIDTDTVLAAGPDGVAGLRPSDGRPRWEFSSSEALSAFRLVGDDLAFLQGEGRLLVLRAGDGRIMDQWGGPAAVHSSDRFSPHLGGDGPALVLQSQAGQPRFISRRARCVTCLKKAWDQPFAPRPPLVLGGNGPAGICLVSGPRQVSSVDLGIGPVPGYSGEQAPRDVRWTYPVPGDTTLTGEPPWLVGGGETLLVLIARNYGPTIQRLDPERGTPLWKEECLLGTQAIGPDCFALDSTAFYFVADSVLRARALSDGGRLWERPLLGPPGRWQVRRAGEWLMAYPLDVPAERFQLRWLGASVEWQITRPFGEPARRGFPLMVFDPKTGQTVQRLNFTPAGAGLTARATFGWPLNPMPTVRRSRPPVESVAPAVLLTDQGVAVALEGKAWGLRGAPK